VKSYRVERFAKLQDSGNRFAFEEATTYERAMKNFQPDAFARETLPAGETLTNPDGYRILKKVGSKLYRVYDDQGELIGTTSTEKAAMRKGQDDFAKKASQEERQTRFQPVSPEQDAAYLSAVKAGDTAKAQALVDEAARIVGINTIRQQNGRLIYNGEDVGTFETTNRADGVVEIDRLYLNKDRQKQGIGGGVIPYLFSKGAKIIEAYPLEESWWLRQSPQSIKPDGSFVFTTPKPSAIKSADPVTYDDAGNVIPLSQRFNPQSPDIRFQPDPLSPNIMVGSNGTRIIKSPSGKFRVYSVTGTLLGIRETEQAAKKLATK
jgi:hypothetical protein